MCISAAYISQTQEQQRFTISEVAADWHELMMLHYAAIHCPRKWAIGPTVQQAEIPPPSHIRPSARSPCTLSYYSFPISLRV